VLYVWYDNEFGYSCQVLRILEDMAGARTPAYPRSAESLVRGEWNGAVPAANR
jgi:glyceraldehyde 3-phosphate dehydrogenase